MEVHLNDRDAIVTKTDNKGIITFVNDDLLRVTGYSEEELIGKKHNIFRHPDMPSELFENLWHTILSEFTWRGVVKNKTKDGGFYWVHEDISPIYENKLLVGYLSVRVKPKINEIKKAEIAYSKITNGTFIGDIIYGEIIEKSNFNNIKRNIENINISTKFGFLAIIILSAIVSINFFDNASLSKLNDNYQNILSQVQYYSNRINLEHKNQLISLDKKIIFFDHDINSYYKNNKIEFILEDYINKKKEISNQKKIELENKNKIISLLIFIILALFIKFMIISILNPLKEAKDSLKEISNGVYRVSNGYRSENELGRLIELIRVTSIRLGFEVANEKKISNAIIKDLEKNNALNYKLNQLQRFESIVQMTAGLAHNFNNMLGTIIGYNQMNIYISEDCKDDDIKKELLENTQKIQEASVSAVKLVKNMMIYAGENIVPTFKSDDISTANIIQNLLNLMRPVLSDLIIITEINKDINIKITDVNLKKILKNLLINSKDSIESHGVIKIKLTKIKAENIVCNMCFSELYSEFIELSISDNGMGINNNIITHIFDPFFTTKPVGKGSGLGLSTVAGMVHEANGHIIVESITTNPNKGTKFSLLFPDIN